MLDFQEEIRLFYFPLKPWPFLLKKPGSRDVFELLITTLLPLTPSHTGLPLTPSVISETTTLLKNRIYNGKP
jgi:hypothetical protein